MSYSLLIADGDLVLRGSNLAIVSGIEKLKQDLQLWVLERFGGDRFHPDMGSIMQDMIGGVIDQSSVDLIRNELFRVLDNYQRLQFKALKETPSLFSRSELLFAIDDINIGVGYDRITATVKVRSAADDTSTITLSQGL